MEYQTRRQSLPWINLLGGIAVGALAMYVADPAQGRRRRALLQDKVTSATHQTSRLVKQTMRDAQHRLSGFQAEAMRVIAPRDVKPIDDHVLEARVRSRLGRALPELQGIEVQADRGVVTLTGSVDDESAQLLLDTVAAIPGVDTVRHELQVAEGRAGGLGSMLSGSGTLWMAGALGAGVLAWMMLSRRQPLGWLAAAGLGLASRSSGLRGMLHADQEGAGFEAQRTIEIAAAPETVFDVWSHYENFPHFMSHVIEVRDIGQDRSHWVVQGPGGTEVEFESVLTAAERPTRLAWQSEPGAMVENEGLVVLEPSPGGTRATVRMAWRPPAGSAGKGLAVLAGIDPEHALEDDLLRMKQFIERGLPARDEIAGTAGAGLVSGSGVGSAAGATGAAAGSSGSTGGNVLH